MRVYIYTLPLWWSMLPVWSVVFWLDYHESSLRIYPASSSVKKIFFTLDSITSVVWHTCFFFKLFSPFLSPLPRAFSQSAVHWIWLDVINIWCINKVTINEIVPFSVHKCVCIYLPGLAIPWPTCHVCWDSFSGLADMLAANSLASFSSFPQLCLTNPK